MENKARYTIVGFFVLTFFIAMVAFVLWLARYNMSENEQKEYRLYVTKSISGLKEKSIVYYKGLEIGNVAKIQVNPDNLEQIEIILKISQPNLVKTNTYAQIESQGVTGNKIIELAGGTQEAELLHKEDMQFAIIPIKTTFLDNLTQSATNITSKTDAFLERLNQLLDEKNIQEIRELINNTNNTSTQFSNLANDVDVLVTQDVKKTLEYINALTQNITTLSNNVNQLINNDIKTIIEEFRQTTKSAQNIDEVMVEFENTLIKLHQTMDNINYNGSNMIFNQRATNYGPGEQQ